MNEKQGCYPNKTGQTSFRNRSDRFQKPVRPFSLAETLDYGIRNVAIQIDSKLKDSFLGILVDDCSKESERYARS
jgi:hypothetical protein